MLINLSFQVVMDFQLPSCGSFSILRGKLLLDFRSNLFESGGNNVGASVFSKEITQDKKKMNGLIVFF